MKSSIALLMVLVVSRGAFAADTTTALPPKLDDAVARGLDYLAKQQNPDGSFSAAKATGGAIPATLPVTLPGTAPAAPAQPLATTGLALLAFLSAGDAPDVGKHGQAVRSAIDYLVSKIPDDGYVGAPKADKGDSSGMHGHAIVTLALAEAYGVDDGDRDKRLLTRAALAKLAAVSLAAQNVAKSEVHAGGWGATPAATDSDLRTTGWNLLALRACRDIGLSVPPENLRRAEQYVLKCRNPLDKGFAAQPGGRGEPATTAVAIVSLRAIDAGASASKSELVDAERYLARAGPPPPSRFPYESMYFTASAALQGGESTWTSSGRSVLDSLIKSQLPGAAGWPAAAAPAGAAASEEPGPVYATAAAVLTLTVPYQLLPLGQR